MRPHPLALTGILLLASCGGNGAGGADAAGSDSPSGVRIEIEDAAPVAAPSDLGVTTSSDGVGSSLVVGGAESAASATVPSTTAAVEGPRSSVVAQAVVANVTARVAPSVEAAAVATLAHPTVVGSPLVFLAVEGQAAPAGWLEVRLPVQPNGTTGWVQRQDVTLFENPFRIEIDRSAHRLEVFHLGQPWLETPIAVGTGATPTPVGDFYLLELLAPPDPTGPYGPYAFGLSGFSEVLDSFGGADSAIIGIHGTDDPSAIGTDVSFGCVRLANDVIEQLATTLPLGTPVRII